MTDTATIASPAVRTRTATSVAKSVIKNLPDHTFTTGTVGRLLRQKVTIEGRDAFVTVQLTFSDTVPRDENGKALSLANRPAKKKPAKRKRAAAKPTATEV